MEALAKEVQSLKVAPYERIYQIELKSLDDSERIAELEYATKEEDTFKEMVEIVGLESEKVFR